MFPLALICKHVLAKSQASPLCFKCRSPHSLDCIGNEHEEEKINLIADVFWKGQHCDALG